MGFLSFLFAFVLLLPTLFWDKGPEQASLLQQDGFDRVAVPPHSQDSWAAIKGTEIEVFDPAQASKLPTPGVDFKAEEASATRQPWVVSNAWHFLRSPQTDFYYDVAGPQAATLAAAESFAWNVHAAIRTDEAGLKPLASMLRFLKSLPATGVGSSVANIGYVDNGTPASGEFMNLLVRRNLLFAVIPKANAAFGTNVQLGTADYPMSEAGNPSLLAEKVRAHLTDEKRSLRIYGSYTVVGRLVHNGSSVRLFLLNYAGGDEEVPGLRVRVLQRFAKHQLANFELPQTTLTDYTCDDSGTEFTLPKLRTVAVVDLQP